MKIHNKVIVVTGGSKGLGKALATLLSQEGAKVVVCARKKGELGTLASSGIEGFVADVTKESDIERLASDVVQKYGSIDVWVNNAGTRIPHGPIEEVDLKRFREMMEVNLFGMVHGARAAIKVMKPKRSGVIVNILSTSALAGRPNSAAYAASKFAAMGFSKSLREGLKDEGIQVINVYPGGMQTNFFDEQKPDDYDDYMDPKFVAGKIVQNLAAPKPEEELIVKRPQA